MDIAQRPLLADHRVVGRAHERADVVRLGEDHGGVGRQPASQRRKVGAATQPDAVGVAVGAERGGRAGACGTQQRVEQGGVRPVRAGVRVEHSAGPQLQDQFAGKRAAWCGRGGADTQGPE